MSETAFKHTKATKKKQAQKYQKMTLHSVRRYKERNKIQRDCIDPTEKRDTANSSCDPEQPGPPLTESTLANKEITGINRIPTIHGLDWQNTVFIIFGFKSKMECDN